MENLEKISKTVKKTWMKLRKLERTMKISGKLEESQKYLEEIGKTWGTKKYSKRFCSTHWFLDPSVFPSVFRWISKENHFSYWKYFILTLYQLKTRKTLKKWRKFEKNWKNSKTISKTVEFGGKIRGNPENRKNLWKTRKKKHDFNPSRPKMPK